MNFLQILMLILQILSKLPRESREAIRQQINFRDLIKLLGDLFQRGGGGGGGGADDGNGGGFGGGGLEGLLALIMFIIRLLSELNDDDAQAMALELKTQVEKLTVE